ARGGGQGFIEVVSGHLKCPGAVPTEAFGERKTRDLVLAEEGRAGLLHVLSGDHGVPQARLPQQVVASGQQRLADDVTRKVAALHVQNSMTTLGQPCGCRAASRPGTDDENVYIHGHGSVARSAGEATKVVPNASWGLGLPL